MFCKSNKVLAPNFNPFELLCITHDERKHSAILAWLFDPLGSHGQGNIFFKTFLSYFDYDAKFATEDYKSTTEFCVKESIIDILIYGSRFIFWVENKTFSQEGHDQTNREYRDLLGFSKKLNIQKNIFPIYLSLSGERPQNKEWRPIAYRELAKALETVIEDVRCVYVQHFVRSWIVVLQKLREEDTIGDEI